ncbi:MAG: outer membrane beta-barrel protein [Bacteroidaceae bacterium]|nr:outer membrane beta-barrel protein [Bacteroidaceae bacterium]
MASAQSISLHAQGQSLNKVLATIRDNQSDYTLHYINNDLEHLKVTVHVKNLPTKEAVERVCKGLPVKLTVKGKDIFVQYKPSKSNRMMTLHGKVYDSRTHHELAGSMVYLLSKDSTVLDSCHAHAAWTEDNKVTYLSNYHFTVPPVQETYILQGNHKGYESGYIEYTISNLHKREFYRELPPLYLLETGKMLKEVVVTASKVKFYHKGDTVVYDASAFQLAEGSMLDALVKQLPGVELKEDGRIYHDGKFVESLLLNGKEFFRGDNRVMLDNLPAYTVRHIKVYEKMGDLSEFVGRKLEYNKQYVMDVQLKKEYSIGYLANIEAAGGTDDRYLARLFAMRFSDHSRLAVYTNANNLNDSNTPSENSVWSHNNTNTGMQTSQRVGIDYHVDDRNKHWTMNGNVRLTHTDNDLQTNTHRVNFLSTGDTYEQSRSMAKDHSLNLATDHKWQYEWKNVELHVKPTLSYTKVDNRSGFTSAASTAEDSLINRNLQQGITRGHDFSTGISSSAYIRFKHSSDFIWADASANFTHKDDDRFNRQQVLYATTASQQSSQKPSTFTDQYFRNHPNWSHTYATRISYTYFIKEYMEVRFHHTYNHKDEHRQQSLYLLDRLDRPDTLDLGVLPSIADYERTMDRTNSYDSHLTENSHSFYPQFWGVERLGKGQFTLGLSLPFTFLDQRLHYQRGDIDTTVVQHKTLFPSSVSNYALWTSDDHKYFCNVFFNIYASAPPINYLVNIRDATDPLNIHEGNSHLRNTNRYSLELRLGKNLKKVQHRATASYQYTHNALSMSYLYNDQTGVRTYHPINVDGNWEGSLSYNLYTPLDRQARIDLSTQTTLGYRKSIDITGTTVPERNEVNTTKLTEHFDLNYQLGKHHLRFEANGNWQHITSPRADFQTINAFEGSTHLTANLQLPWKLSLTTSLSTFLRRGYDDPSMNDTEWCWNARLSRPFLKSKMLVMFDGFDLFNQIGNVTQTVNAQGRTETRVNVLHRYVLLHVVWRMNHQPKKKHP